MPDKPIILYVDDEFLNLKLFEVKFGNKYHILTAENGSRGLELLESVPNVRIVISDMKMSDINGIDLTKKAIEKYPAVDYFILTGYDINEEIRKAYNSGLIKKYFCKPLNFLEISSSIEEVLSAE
ncbi:MAG TPA: response regulator [Bacteroidales bacterium]|nr:response regulator [Bacteroidales bacterium]